ncbi:MAG: hypothetical protein KIS89_12690, partial [Dokdonella sp.]|nr:hypothetical protein [Dokdonella sp.]
SSKSQVFRSSDGGSSWHPSSVGLPMDHYRTIIVDKDRPNYLYLAGDEGVFYSGNSGASWNALGSKRLQRPIGLFVGADHVYVSGSQGIQRTPKPVLPNLIFRSGFESGAEDGL